jgi:hypothetical protein
MVAPVLAMLAGQALSAGLGASSANRAAKTQEQAAKQAADAQRRAAINNLLMNEPQRQLGYGALSDLGSLYGYQTAPYTPVEQVINNLNPLGGQQVKLALKKGATFDQLRQMGTLGDLNAKTMKRLLNSGLSYDQIRSLQGMGATAPAPGTSGASGVAPAGSAGAASGAVGAMGAPAGAAPAASGATGAGNFGRFFASPDYQFRQQQGMQGIERSAAARGGAASGNALRALTEFNSNLAANEYGNYFERLSRLAGLGSAATNNAQQSVGGYGNAMSNAASTIGDARASGILGVGNSISNAINGGINNYLMSRYMSPSGSPVTGINSYQAQQAFNQIPAWDPIKALNGG